MTPCLTLPPPKIGTPWIWSMARAAASLAPAHRADGRRNIRRAYPRLDDGGARGRSAFDESPQEPSRRSTRRAHRFFLRGLLLERAIAVGRPRNLTSTLMATENCPAVVAVDGTDVSWSNEGGRFQRAPKSHGPADKARIVARGPSRHRGRCDGRLWITANTIVRRASGERVRQRASLVSHEPILKSFLIFPPPSELWRASVKLRRARADSRLGVPDLALVTRGARGSSLHWMSIRRNGRTGVHPPGPA
jgi:hypothetical protein